ncbi:hypothetical protein EGI26_08125 [Lacihabitans sp. CCS-44]|nr:hypothetical protein [Lacihabitans sp. CCS-44]
MLDEIDLVKILQDTAFIGKDRPWRVFKVSLERKYIYIKPIKSKQNNPSKIFLINSVCLGNVFVLNLS